MGASSGQGQHATGSYVKLLLPYWETQLIALGAKNLSANAGDVRDEGLIPESGRSPGGRNDTSLWHSCQENTMDRGARQGTVMGLQRVRHD